MSPTPDFLTLRDGTRLRVKSWGQGRPILMLHGWPLSADTFDDLACALADAGFRAVSYDRRGFGASSQPDRGYDYDSLADDTAEVIEQLGLERLTLLGFSMGGGEVARYLSRHRGRAVEQAILVASVVPFMLQTEDNPAGVETQVFHEMAHALREDRARFWTAFFKDFYGIGLMHHPVSDEVLRWSADQAMRAGLLPTLACMQSFATTDFRPDLMAFERPTLIVHGTDDKTVPIATSARAAARAIGHAHLVEIDGAPHGLLATHKAQIEREVLDFMRQLD